jgi:hypothetical protein
MDLYTFLKNEACNLDEVDFVQQHDGCYLFGRMPQSQKSPMPFVTQVHKLEPDGQLQSDQEPTDQPERLWKVEKSERNSWNRHISLGRATNNDIVIRHDSISKLHAHFSTTPLIPEEPSDYLLTDVGSSNGTEVNGAPLADDTSAPIRNGDRVVFGQIIGQFLDASTLHSELNALDWF